MKFSGNPSKYECDASGQWWHRPYKIDTPRGGTRFRVSPDVCKTCGADFVPAYRGKRIPGESYCSKRCGFMGFIKANPDRWKSDNSARWKGGRRVQKGGYIGVYSPDHPRLKGTKRKYVLEHRLVMERMIGRYLLDTEFVHHKNGRRDDNRPGNLELWQTSQPVGQRATEIAHCPTCRCHLHS